MDTSEAEQWRSHQESDQYQPSAKLPRLQPVDALALFAPTTEPMKTSNMPPYSTPTTFPRMGYFSLAQWQELELQALIYKYMLAGAPVPMELILPIRKNLLLTGIPYYHHHSQQYHHLQQAILPSGYWGRCVIDPEPGRCRRTDGKKWRCSREVVPGQKYCERHVHRGRNRSRKHVEIPTSSAGSGLKTTFPSSLMSTSKETQFSLSGSSPPLDILPLNQRPDSKPANGCLPQSYSSSFTSQDFQDNRSDCRVLRKFFDDWPRSQQEPSANNASNATSTTSLSISISGNSTSDFSLKLSTGNSDHKPGQVADEATADEGVQQPALANWSGWGNHGEASMGGPLAEALRSSTSTPSPTSVLQKANGCV